MKRVLIAAVLTVMLSGVVANAQYTPGAREVGAWPSQTFSTYADDFFSAGYIAAAATTNHAAATVLRGGKFSEVADHAEWLVSTTDGDGDDLETITIADNGGSGWLEIKTNNKAVDAVEIQKNGEAFTITAAKDLWYEAKIAIDDVSADRVFIGLTVADTDVLGSFGNDFIGFYLNQNTNSFQMAKNGTIVTNASITTMTDTGATVGGNAKVFSFYVDGSAGDVWAYVDGVEVGFQDGSSSVPNDEALSPVFGILTVDTGADSLFVDYFSVRQHR
ncbi:MAG: hypothetical protein OEN49_06875 [Gammaproteobacteria bacterium]|nr:hypothetical protein [Gammaproteobacteria bacterium]